MVKSKKESMKHHPITKKEHDVIKTMRKHEKNETRKEEKAESPRMQKMERKLGIEKHARKGHHATCSDGCTTKHRMKDGY